MVKLKLGPAMVKWLDASIDPVSDAPSADIPDADYPGQVMTTIGFLHKVGKVNLVLATDVWHPEGKQSFRTATRIPRQLVISVQSLAPAGAPWTRKKS